MSDRRVLRRAQWGTLAAGALGAAVTWLAGWREFGSGLGVGAAWSALNLRILEGLLSEAIVPRDREKRNGLVRHAAMEWKLEDEHRANSQ